MSRNITDLLAIAALFAAIGFGAFIWFSVCMIVMSEWGVKDWKRYENRHARKIERQNEREARSATRRAARNPLTETAIRQRLWLLAAALAAAWALLLTAHNMGLI